MTIEEEFDYIVVGAGSAGCVVARRLLDRLDARVLLLEAGDPDDLAAVHGADLGSVTSLWGPGGPMWDYRTEAQPELNDRQIQLAQGRVLGGGSSVNALMYVRGNAQDFDGWRAAGNEGWGYQDVLPYFRRAEDFDGGESAYRGAGGPMTVTGYREPSEVSRAFVRSVAELGLAAEAAGRAGAQTGAQTGAEPVVRSGVESVVRSGVEPVAEQAEDYNGARQDGGAFLYQSTRTADRRRVSSVAYLTPLLGDRRLTVRTGAQATRVLFAGDRACGVEYVRDGVRQVAAAGTEVILTAGALASPKLLLLSGIGSARQLREVGVAPRTDLPGVGRNLQDHLLYGIAYQSLRELPFPQLLAEAGLFTHSGPASPGTAPDLQYFFGPVQFVDDKYRTDEPGFTFAPVLVRPESRGSVTLRSADPLALPVIDPRYLSAPQDLRVLVRGLEIARELVHTRAFEEFRGKELAPGADVTDPAALARYVRESASTVWHPAGTCRMGQGPDAVVDQQLRVHGVSGLRVADASVMPSITTGNTNAATVMIAEKAADLIADAADAV